MAINLAWEGKLFRANQWEVSKQYWILVVKSKNLFIFNIDWQAEL